MRVLLSCIAAIVNVCIGAGTVLAQVPGTQGVTTVFSTGPQEVAAYDATAKQLFFFTISGETAKQVGVVSVPGQVMGVVSVGDEYVIATGMGRGDLTPPIRVHKLAKREVSLKNSSLVLIYERITERPQITQLRVCGGRVWLGFFESKYNTSIGELSPPVAGATGQWNFAQNVGIRMGDSFDCFGEYLVVGRSYGDDQGHDGDLILFHAGQKTLLPSYRGVRGVQSIGDAVEPMLIIGDGWHSNYGQMAQGRVSLLKKRRGEPRFSLELLDLDKTNFNFTKFRDVTVGSERHLVALGSSQVIVYSGLASPELKKRVVYTQVGKSHVLDVAVGSVASDSVTLAVADEGLRIIKVAG